MKHLCLVFLLLFPFIYINGQKENPFRAPLNEAFVNQSDQSGYIHPPFKVEHDEVVREKSTIVLPSNFDLRSVDGSAYIPLARNQGSYGTCWAFACFASVESGWKMGGDDTFTNLSEGNMAKCHGFEYAVKSGGNEYIATAYLSRLSGPVYEKSDPYSDVGNDSCISIDKDTDMPGYIDNVVWMGNDRDYIKEMIMTYGAVATSMYGSFGTTYYDKIDYTYYCNKSEGTTHGVAIIGWDDDKMIYGGTAGAPSNKGAWIVRNSWGRSWGDRGCFYASYDDYYIGKDCELYYGKTNVNDIDTLFDYAKLGAVTSYKASSSKYYAYAAVKYHANADYFITHVGTHILRDGSTVDIAICNGFDGNTFTDTITYLEDVYFTYAGYYKTELPAPVSEGDFYLVMKYHTPNYLYPLPAETKITNYAIPVIEEGKMWISGNGVNWTQGGLNTSYNFDLAVKVIAKDLEDVQPYFETNKHSTCLDQDVTFINQSIGAIDSFIWCFPEDTFMTENLSENITLPFDTVGDIKVTLIAYKDGVAYSFTRSSAVTIISEIPASLTILEEAEYYAKGKPVTLTGSGGDTYRWYADGYLYCDSGSSITISPDVDSIMVVMVAEKGGCSGYDSVLLHMIDVPYDDIEDALLLNIGETVENISNEYATVQDDEPLPPTGSCESQTKWCAEGGLHNSLWFKFAAPSSGSVSITTYGFDNQIALYDATESGSYNDIVSGDDSKYTILAANDDYHYSDYSAKISKVENMTEDKIYWIQMDGSGGGSTGEMSIVVDALNTAGLGAVTNQTLDVINTIDKFEVKGKNIENSDVAIINSLGQIVYTTALSSDALHLSGVRFTNGLYFVSIKNRNLSKVYRVIISNDWQLSIISNQ